MVKDLTRGNPFRLIVEISIPIFISYLVQQLYNMADTIVVGQMVGSTALAAVGSTSNLYNFILTMLTGLTQGFAVIVSNRFGGSNPDEVRSSIFHSIVLVAGVSVLLTIPSAIFLKDLLRLMNTPEEILDLAYSYIIIIVLGMIVTAGLNLMYALLRSLGDARTPLYFLVASSILNVILDVVFVLTMENGVAAVGLATILAQMAVLAACTVYVRRRMTFFHFSREDRKLRASTALPLLRIGVPMALQGAITQVGFLALQSAINTFGVSVIAGYTAGNKLEQFCLQPIYTFGSAIAAYVGQNFGAKQKERIREGVRACVILAVGTSILLGILLRVFGTQLLGLFVEQGSDDVLQYGLQYVNTFSLFLTGVAMIFLFRNVLQGMANVTIPMGVGVLELVARLLWVAVLYRQGSYTALCFVNPITWVAAAIPLVVGYIWIMHTKKDPWERA